MPKESPFTSFRQFARVLLKAVLIAAAINVALLALGANPVRGLVRLNPYDLLGRGRARLAYPSDFQNGQLPLDALLAAHAISQPKAADEYRVVLLGDSGVAGWGLADGDTLADRLTAQDITVGGRDVVAYNLGYPQGSALRDLLILDASLAYDPDMIVWLANPAVLNNQPDDAGQNRVFFDLNRARLAALAERYPAQVGPRADGVLAALPEPPAWQRAFAIRDQSLLPVWLGSLLYPVVSPDLAISDRRIGLEDAPAEAQFTADLPGFREMPGPAWGALPAGCDAAAGAGAGLLVANEPIAVSGGPHAETSYNQLYGRALYDRYRAALADYTQAQGIPYVDLWDAVPPEYFTDTPTHMDADGSELAAQALAAAIERMGDDLTCD